MIKKHILVLVLLSQTVINAFSQEPPKTFQPDGTAGKDAYIAGSVLPSDYTAYDNSNYGSALEFLSIRWTTNTVYWTGKSLIQFDLTGDPNNNIPTNAIVTSAALYLYSAGHDRQGSNSNASVLRRITSSWTESGVTWNDSPSDDGTQGDITLAASTSSGQDYTLDVTSHVQSMVQVPANNHGWILRLQGDLEQTSARTKLSFHSSDASDPAKRPKLVVNYYLPLSLNGESYVPICYGGSQQMQASPTGGSTGTYTYSWTPSTGLNATNISNPVATPAASTAYTCTVTNGGVSVSALFTVTVNPAITVNVSANQTICAGSSTTALGSAASGGTGPYTYAWLPATGLNNSSIYNPIATPASTTTYSLTVTDDIPCSNTKSVTVTVNPVVTPAVSIAITSGTNPTCSGSSVTFTATPVNGGTSPSYQWKVNGTNVGTNSTTYTSTTLANTNTVTCVMTSNANCRSTSTVTSNNIVMTVNAIPTVNVSPASSTICSGTGTTLTASGATTYVWSPGTGLNTTTGASVTASPTTTITYTVTGTTSGCAGTKTVTVTVNTIPSVTVTPASPTICNGSSTTLTASGATTYAWSPGTGLNTTTGASVTASPTTTITYTVTGTTSGCAGTKTVTVTVSPILSISVAPASPTICNGSGTTLTASGATTYAWSPGTGLNTTTGASVTASPTTTITYTVTGTTSGCSGTKTVTVTVNPVPSVTVTPSSAAICNGNSTTLTASGATTYSWGPAAGLNTTTGASVIASPAVTTTYTVTGTTNGCIGTKTVAVTVNSAPTVNISPASVTIANGTSTTLTASGASTYVWSPATALNTTTGASVVASPTTTITYTVTGTAANGCVGTNSVTVTCENVLRLVFDGGYMHMSGGTNSNPVYLIVDDHNTINITRLASGGHIYTNGQYNFVKWNTGVTTGSYIVPFGVEATAADYIPFTFNKTGTENANLSVSTWYTNPQNMPHPDVSSVPAVTKMTGSGDSLTTAIDRFWDVRTSATTTADLTFSYRSLENTTGITGDEIKMQRWSPSGCLLWSSLLGPGNSGAVVGVGTIGPVTGVTNFSPFVAVRSAKPLLTSGSAGLVVNAGSDNMVCPGASTTLGASPTATGGTAPYTYSWLPAQFLNNAAAANPVSTPSSSVTYTLSVVDQQGCNALDEVNIQVAGLTVNPAASATICAGDNIELNASGMSSYSWSPASSLSSAFIANPVAFPTATTTYSLSASHNSCSDARQIAITVLAVPTLSVVANQQICIGQSTNLNATGTGSFQWTPSTGLSNPSIANPNASPSTSTEYTVKLTSANACSTEKKVSVLVDNIPVIQLGGNVTICQAKPIRLDAVAGAQQFQWAPVTGLDDPTSPSPVASPTSSTTYTVTAINGMCSSSSTIGVSVKNAPSAIFTFSYPGLQVQFSTNNTDPAVYAWDFGDGTTSSQASPSHTYAAEGTYRVCLNAENECGISRRFCTDLIVKPPTVSCCQ